MGKFLFGLELHADNDANTILTEIELERELCSGKTVVAPRCEVRLSFGAPKKCPPIIVAASGPKTLQLAGRIGDGVIISAGTPRSSLQKAMDYIQAGFKERTLPKDNFQI